MAPDQVAVGQTPSGWFTSLWTLQEASLRPDMKLCSRHWEILKICDSPHAPPITIDSILALVDHYQRTAPLDAEGKIPAVAMELCALTDHTCLTELLQYSPLSVLVLGNQRECLERRAEAIMSAIGAINWYTGHEDSENALLLGKYPVEFLREVRQLLGAEFFASNYRVCCFWDVFKPGASGELDLAVAGTLLPFDSLRGLSKFVLDGDSHDRFDHPATNSWQIEDDGRVIVPQAGIVISTGNHGLDKTIARADERLVATVIGPISEAEPQKVNIPEEVDLHVWMSTIFSDIPKHAVCLRQDARGWSQGVTLMALLEDEMPLEKFAKLGDFYTAQGEKILEAPTVAVDWEIF